MNRSMRLYQILTPLCMFVVSLTLHNSVQAQSHRAPENNPPQITGKGSNVKTPTTQKVLVAYSHGDPTVEEQYTLELMNRASMQGNAQIISWRGRVMIYSGNATLGKQIIQSAL